jgi:DNA-binding response OmpR family regulator
MLGRRRLTNLDTIQGSFITPTMGNRIHGDKRSGKEKKTEVVFLVADEQDTADLVRLQLVNAGMSVLHVKDGRQATDIIDKIMPPRAVLLDLAVPYVNGFELLKMIRTKAGWEKVPVMIVSGNSNAGEIQRMMRAGAKDYVVKSVGVGALAHRLQSMLEKGA